MPKPRRHRRGRRSARKPSGGLIVTWVAVALLLAVAVGSIAEIHAQSAGYRRLTARGYGGLVTPVIDASNRTGARLSTLLKEAPTIPNRPWVSVAGHGARALIEQGLDEAVASAKREAVQAAHIAPPGPRAVSGVLVGVLVDRATEVTALRTTLDRMLGMQPLPVAGSTVGPGGSGVLGSSGTPSITVPQADRQAASEGSVFERSDRAYARLAGLLRRGKIAGIGPIRLPASAWAPSGSPLSSSRLGVLPGKLASPNVSPALIPFHQLVVTAVGLVPPAVPSSTPGDLAGSGIVAVSCGQPSSVSPGTAPTVLPPTATVTAEATVTNCGTVSEIGIPVRATLSLADPAGIGAPPAGRTGGTVRTTVTIAAGGSQSLVLGGLKVAAGHTYTLTIAIQVPRGLGAQVNLAGTTQELLLKIAG